MSKFDDLLNVCIEKDMTALVEGMPLAERVQQTVTLTAQWSAEQATNRMIPENSGYRLYLREHRQKHGYNLIEVSEQIGLHYTSIQKWETGISSPTIAHLSTAAKTHRSSAGGM